MMAIYKLITNITEEDNRRKQSPQLYCATGQSEGNPLLELSMGDLVLWEKIYL